MRRSLRAVSLVGIFLLLASCTPRPPTYTVRPNSSNASPSGSASSTPSGKTWPTVGGLPGGSIEMDGGALGRDDGDSTSKLLVALGDPDEQHASKKCGSKEVASTTYRWGDFKISVLNEVDDSNEFGDTYPPGAIAGWRIDPTLDGAEGLIPNATGPLGTAIGTPLATLKTRFPVANWIRAEVTKNKQGNVFSIFAGQTNGATFELGKKDRVSAMWAGYQC